MVPSNYWHCDSSGSKSSACFHQQMDHNTHFYIEVPGFHSWKFVHLHGMSQQAKRSQRLLLCCSYSLMSLSLFTKIEIADVTKDRKGAVSLLIQNGIHPKYNIISSQWEKFCDLALLTCLHRWSLESKTKAISEKAPLYYMEIWTGVLYHVNETYVWVAFSSQRISVLILIER